MTARITPAIDAPASHRLPLDADLYAALGADCARLFEALRAARA